MALDVLWLIVVHVHLVNLFTLIEFDWRLNLADYVPLFVVARNFQSDAGEIVTRPEFELPDPDLVDLAGVNRLH